MVTFDDMLNPFETPTELAEAISVPYQTARKMKERKSVAARHWPKFRKALEARGFDVSLEQLAEAQIAKAAST